MLTISVPKTEYYDSDLDQILTVNAVQLTLEHSLLSISKWESKWNKPFFADTNKTTEELLDYIKCMIVGPKTIDERIIGVLRESDISKIVEYIKAPMTATTIKTNGPKKRNKETITSELIYYWMVAYNIPFECEKWHINRLLTLVKICDIKNSPKNKMSKRDTINYYKNLNEARKASMGTRG